jgi:Protein kinase domain
MPAAIGKYRVIGRFPRSGQAQVFRAAHPALPRELVLKLANQPVDADGHAALVEEGRRLVELEHPNIVRVHDLDFDDGRPYLVMEYVRGRTLGQYAREERLAPRRAAVLLAEVAGAIAFAHRRGIVHQDIKPANVLIDEAGRPRLIDFGLAWQQDAWSDSERRSEGGTFAYMAPEQARADTERVRTLSDVFALGGLLYFLLTGTAPFEAATREASWERARRCDLDGSALKRAGVPRGLERIVLRAMAADPRSRFLSAEALGRALERDLLLRRAAPMLGATAIGLGLVISAWAFWPWAVRRSLDGPARSVADGGTVGRSSAPKPAATAGLRLLRFEIALFGKRDRDHDDPNRSGVMGRTSFGAREDDDVTVRAELSEPAYSYLIAFRPDGTEELCDPGDEAMPPAREPRPSYPPPLKSDERYRLSEGPGLYAFALVASREPLPSYREWKHRVGPMPWAAKAPYEPGIVRRVDDHGLQVLLADNAGATRGKGAKARDSGGPAGELANWLRSRTGLQVVMVEAFAVEPAAKP